MGEVRLNAIGIDELRDLFSGSDAAANRLRELAVAAFPTPARAVPRTLLSRLGGPLVKRPLDAPIIRPGVPTGTDITDLVHGRDIPPHRLSAAWTLVRLWLDDNSWGSLVVEVDRVEDLDFDLSRLGLDPRFSLGHLLNDQLALPLKALPGQATGHVRHGHALAMADAWRERVDDVPLAQASAVRDVVAWLDRFPGWAADANEAGRPAPDLVATYVAAAE
jgi:hypothetical protein